MSVKPEPASKKASTDTKEKRKPTKKMEGEHKEDKKTTREPKVRKVKEPKKAKPQKEPAKPARPSKPRECKSKPVKFQKQGKITVVLTLEDLANI